MSKENDMEGVRRTRSFTAFILGKIDNIFREINALNLKLRVMTHSLFLVSFARAERMALNHSVSGLWIASCGPEAPLLGAGLEDMALI